jgi:hypothetical protein
MEIFLVALLAVGATYFYVTRQPGVPGASQTYAPYQVRNQGPVIGTTPPGVSLPGQSVEGPGPNTAQSLVGTAGSTGLGFATMASTTAGVTALGAATLGVGAIIGVGFALWQAHAARVKGAKDENAVLNELVPNFSKALIAEFNALNAGQISPTTALQDLEGIRTTYWQAIASYQKGPGQHTHPCNALRQDDPLHTGEYAPGCIPWNSAKLQTTPCDKTCTAGCCIGCDYVEPAICAAKWLIQQMGGGTVKLHGVGAGPYGYSGQPGFSLTYVPYGG